MTEEGRREHDQGDYLTDRKPSVWIAGGVPCYSANAFGGCLRALVAERMGYEPVHPSQRQMGIFSAGHRAEDECLLELRKAGWALEGAGQSEARLVVHLGSSLSGPTVVIVGHIDEMCSAPEEYAGIVEIKSQGPSSWEDYERHGPQGWLWDRYAWQASIYMYAHAKPLTWVRWRRPKLDDNGNPDITAPMWSTHRLTEPPISLDEIKARAQEIEDWAARGDFPPCSKTQDWNCPFRYLHGDEEDLGDGPGAIIEVPGISYWASALKSAQAAKKDAEERYDEAKAKLLAMLEEGGYTGSVRARDGSALVVVTRSSRKYLDEVAMRADGVDPEKYRKAGKEFARVDAKLTKGWA